MQLQKIKKSFNIILFGASGDLAKLKLFPALFELAWQKRFIQNYRIFGFARTPLTQAAFKKMVMESIQTKFKTADQKSLNAFLDHLHYFKGQYDSPKDFKSLSQALLKAETFAYFGVPPIAFKPIIAQLAELKKRGKQDIKLILEKPLGEDEKSATEIFHFVSQFFEEDHIFLLDHYLGKTPVQSILPLRTTNTILNVLLQGQHISNIQVSALEDVGVGERVGYFEAVGILKDMIQSHLLQILALITMAIPLSQTSKAIRREKMHILSALRYGPKGCAIVLGQYKNYQKEKGVKRGSKTATFAALRCFIDLLDWLNVPIYLRTGKRLHHKYTYIVVEFKKPILYHQNKSISANKLIIELAPEEKIQIRLVDPTGKTVAARRELISTESLTCTGDDCLSEHGRLILETMLGDHTHFVSFEEILASWRFVDRVVKRIEKDKITPILYNDGSEGPADQHKLTTCDKVHWYDADAL